MKKITTSNNQNTFNANLKWNSEEFVGYFPSKLWSNNQRFILGEAKLKSFICLSPAESIGSLLCCDQAYLLDSLE